MAKVEKKAVTKTVVESVKFNLGLSVEELVLIMI